MFKAIIFKDNIKQCQKAYKSYARLIQWIEKTLWDKGGTYVELYGNDKLINTGHNRLTGLYWRYTA
jgi:effector-binding domain-containing protein